ncbi:hypothetical protein B0H19DRAFT_1245375 [Mycena capillaripes]|nr:hypothetical protein B0H19DRAFT_1245375 [Mycena capillaripes]
MSTERVIVQASLLNAFRTGVRAGRGGVRTEGGGSAGACVRGGHGVQSGKDLSANVPSRHVIAGWQIQGRFAALRGVHAERTWKEGKADIATREVHLKK